MKKLMLIVLHKIYVFRNRLLRKIILRIVKKLERGQHCSETLRSIFRDYHNIEVGLYSYGCFAPECIAPFTKIDACVKSILVPKKS